jgi:callose synthase
MQIYLLDIHVFYTVMSAIYGFLLGARDRLGEVASLNFSFELLYP